MATLKCPECGKEFDGTKLACPDCGCPAKDCSIVEPIKQVSKNAENLEMHAGMRFTKQSLLQGESIVASAEWEIAPVILIVFTCIALLAFSIVPQLLIY